MSCVSVLCPNCAADNPETGRFCGMCGAPLSAVPARRERRRVTTVFFDLAGFSTLTRDFDPEALRDLADDVLTVVAGIVEAYDGYVDAFQGDGLIALFGAPHSHPNDPERAVLAAAEGLRAVEEIGRAKGYSLRGRAGVNTGLVIAGDLGAGKIKGYTVMGSAVNLAARLEAAATPGEVWVGPETYRATRHALRFVPSPVLTLQGFPDVTQAHRFVQETRQRDPYAHLRFVGREPERVKLWSALRRAEAASTPLELWLVGEAGSGKTRLAREFCDEAAKAGRARVVWLEADEGHHNRLRLRPPFDAPPHDPPYTPPHALPHASAHSVSAADVPQDAAHDDAHDAAAGVPEPFPSRAWLEQLTGTPEDAARASTDGPGGPPPHAQTDDPPPLLIVADAPHGALLPLLEALRRAPTKGLVLRLTRKRPVDSPENGPEGAAQDGRDVLTLPPLTTDDCLSILAELVDPSLGLVTRSLVHETGGNPAYTIELGRTLANARTGAFSGSLSSLLQARLDMLAPAQRYLLAQIALIGERSWLGLAGLLAESSRADLGALLADDLLMREDTSSLPGEVELRFRSELLRRAALLMVPFSERPALHLRVARWLGPRVGAELRALVEHHLREANLHAPALGTER